MKNKAILDALVCALVLISASPAFGDGTHKPADKESTDTGQAPGEDANGAANGDGGDTGQAPGGGTNGMTGAPGGDMGQAGEGATNGAANVDPQNFVAEVDNPFFPLQPGTTYVDEGIRDGTTISNVVTVTGETRVISGVPTTVVRDEVFENGVLVERTSRYYAQDREGNVWQFGELDEGGTEGSWEAGVNGAQPGIVMEADPRAGNVYAQEVAPGVAEDMATVVSTREVVRVPFGTFKGVVVTEDFTPLEPGVREKRVYARDIGFVRSEQVEGGQETLELVDIIRE